MSSSCLGLRIRVSVLLPGFLAFLGYYDLLSALTIPFRFTVDRVTNTYLVRAPLLGGLEVDFLAYALAASLTARQEEERKFRLTYLLAITTSAIILLLCRFLELEWPVYLALGIAALLSAAIPTLKRGPSALLPGILLSTALLEASALLSLSTYYISGGWGPVPFQVVLRERLFWAPLEWVLVPLLVAGMWMALALKILGWPLPRLLETQPGNPGDGGNPRGLLILALSLTCMFIVLPHLPTVNPELKAVSVDTVSYRLFFDRVGGGGAWEALRRRPERPFFILLIYHLWVALSGNSILLMDLVYPLFALGLLVLASYYAGLRLGGPTAAGWSSLMVPLGYMVPAFIGGGFQANSLALTPAILALTIDPKGGRGALKLSVLLSLVALLHPWTYLMYISALTLKALRDRGRLTPTLLSIAFSYAVSQAVDYALGGIVVAEVAARPVTGSWGFHLPASWFEAIQFYVWNTMSNPLYLSTALLPMEPATTTMMAVAAPLTLILPGSLIYRLTLNIPTQLQASYTIRKLGWRERNLILLALLARTLGNLSGLTPIEESWWPT
jgi:hypothetical protein